MRAMAVVPTDNEALNIASLLREILKQGPDIGAVVVDDNSPDGTARPDYITYFLSQMEDCDLLIGSRLANAYIRLILPLPVRDCTSGYRVFRREVLEAIDLDRVMSQEPSVVEEVLYKAYKRGFRIKEVPSYRLMFNASCYIMNL